MKPLGRRRFLVSASRGVLGLAGVSFAGLNPPPAFAQQGAGPRVMRFATNPIIRPDMLRNGGGKNINGPSLIRVPEWISKPLGRYYLYFADHAGKYIRLAYADDLPGPWRVYDPGTLRLDQAPDGKGPRKRGA